MRYYVKASHKKVAHKNPPTKPTIKPKNKEAVHKYYTKNEIESFFYYLKFLTLIWHALRISIIIKEIFLAQ